MTKTLASTCFTTAVLCLIALLPMLVALDFGYPLTSFRLGCIALFSSLFLIFMVAGIAFHANDR